MPFFDQDRLEKISALFVEELFDEEGSLARKYLEDERDLDPEILRPYEVGFCPPQVTYPCRDKRSLEGHLWYMRGRLIVTIRDHWGNILGFNGRRIDECEEPLRECLCDQYGVDQGNEMTREWTKRKWVNESYQKSNFVFNLHRRKRDILKSGSVVVVEGCMDAIVLDAMGVTNVVSMLGTAISSMQIYLMKRYADHLVICFDPDLAGAKASEMILSNAREKGGMSSTIIKLNAGMDPDEAIMDPKEAPFLKQALINASDTERNGDTIDLSSSSTRLALKIASSRKSEEIQ